jgi:hypothetical protein
MNSLDILSIGDDVWPIYDLVSDEGFVYVEYFDTEHPCYFSYGRTRSGW